MTDKKNTDTARKIWLAGIGAYGRAFSEVQEGLTKASKGTSKVFDELVEKGEVLETIVTHKGKEAFDKVSDKIGDTVSDTMGDGFDMDERIAKMRSRLKRGGGTSDVEARLDAIEAKLDAVLTLLKPKKAAPKKTTPRKTAPRKKPAAKK